MEPGVKTCGLCGRAEDHLTRHHLIPRTRHHNKRTRRTSSRAEREQTVLLCHACHKQVHALLTEKELERRYDTVEKIAAHPEIARFVDWVRRQPPGKHITVRTARGSR
jgi:5-methylcytosine-specific restriction endonuclease McrA